MKALYLRYGEVGGAKVMLGKAKKAVSTSFLEYLTLPILAGYRQKYGATIGMMTKCQTKLDQTNIIVDIGTNHRVVHQ